MREGLQHQPLDGDLPPARRASAMIDFKYERRKDGYVWPAPPYSPRRRLLRFD